MIDEKEEVKADTNARKYIAYLFVHPCIDCGEKDPVVLDADHVRGEKIHNLSHMVNEGYSWDKIETELEKCEIRCANCHRRKTARDFKHRRYGLVMSMVA